jgi:hypothetical protein
MPTDELSVTLCLGVPQRGVGTNWLESTTRAESQLVCVDVSDVGCMDAKNSMESQERLLGEQGIDAGIWWVHQADICNFLISPEDYGVNLHLVRRCVTPLTLGYLGYDTANVVLHMNGLFLSEDQDPHKLNCDLVIGHLQGPDDNPERYDEQRKLWYYRREEIVRKIQSSAGRKVEVIRERRFRYFGEIVTALMIKAK